MSAVHHHRRLSGTPLAVARFVALSIAALGFWFGMIAVIHGICWATAKLEGKIPGVHALVLRK